MLSTQLQSQPQADAEPTAPRQAAPAQHTQPLCHFVTGARGSGRTRHILGRLREIAAIAPPDAGTATIAVLLAGDGRTRAETLAAAFPGLVLRRLFLPCQCCPELARLPSALLSAKEANPGIKQIFIEVPDFAAPRLIEEFDQSPAWPRKVVVCMSAAWGKALRLGALPPLYAALVATADTLVEPAGQSPAGRAARDENSPTAAPFDLSLP